MLDICGWSGGCRNYWGKMDTNEMLMRHWLQVAPLTLLCSGGLSVPTPFPWDPPRDLLGCRRILLSPQHGRGPPIGSSLFAPCMVFIHWFEYMQMLQWSLRQRKLPPRPPHCPPPPVSLHFPRSIPFCLSPCCCLLCSVGWELWEPDLLCHSDLFKRGVRLLITRHRLTVYEVEGRKNGGVFHTPYCVSE